MLLILTSDIDNEDENDKVVFESLLQALLGHLDMENEVSGTIEREFWSCLTFKTKGYYDRIHAVIYL